MALCAVLYCIHFSVYSFWYIEDAAISFAFAHHAAIGEGFVAYPGGERVEGFSNPSWTLLIAALDFIGLTPWISAKLLGFVFGLLTLPVAWAWACLILEDDGDQPGPPTRRLWPLVAPLMLAASPQFVLWAASGLENSLFNLMLALGAWLTLREARDGTAPVSALAWAGLALTRPEAPLYAALGGVLGFGFVSWRQGVKRGLAWGVSWNLLFAVTFGTWFVWRWNYFSWIFPNTYYAKLAEDERFQPFSWDKRGWAYLRRYALETGHGFLTPVYALGQTGLMGRRGTIGIGLCMVGVMLVAPGLSFVAERGTEPEWWIMARVIGLATMVVVLPIVGLGRPGHDARVLAWSLSAVAIFFALYTGGDWMQQFRWLSMASVPMAALFADAVRMIADEIAAPDEVGTSRLARARTTMVWAIPGVLLAYPIIAWTISDIVFIARAETTPYDVKRRVDYMRSVQARLHLDHVTLMEVDMGVYMWWSGFRFVDIAGLVDVPMAHHHWEIPFVRDYVYTERQPEFAHVHPSGGWGSRTKLRAHKGWHDYIEIPAFPVSPRLMHVGNNVRKDLIAKERWRGTSGRATAFGAPKTLDARMLGFEIPAAQVAAGQELYVEIATQRTSTKRDFRVHMFLSNGTDIFVQELPPAYDWLHPSKKGWHLKDVMVARHSLRLPADLPQGKYDVGFALFGTDDKAEVIPARPKMADPRYVHGEVRYADLVTIVPLSEATDRATARLARALEHLSVGRCEAGHQLWNQGRRHLAREHPWQEQTRATIDDALASCFALRAEAAESDIAAVEAIAQANLWSHRQTEARRVSVLLADRWEADGDALEAQGDDQGAYLAWRNTLAADPSRAWVRHRAETSRDRVLEAKEAVDAAQKKARIEESRKRREARKPKGKPEKSKGKSGQNKGKSGVTSP